MYGGGDRGGAPWTLHEMVEVPVAQLPAEAGNSMLQRAPRSPSRRANVVSFGVPLASSLSGRIGQLGCEVVQALVLAAEPQKDKSEKRTVMTRAADI